MEFRWRAHDGPIDSFVKCQGIWTSIAKKPYIFVIFRLCLCVGPDSLPLPPLDPRMLQSRLSRDCLKVYGRMESTKYETCKMLVHILFISCDCNSKTEL